MEHKLEYGSIPKLLVSFGPVFATLPTMGYFYFLVKASGQLITKDEYANLSAHNITLLNLTEQVLSQRWLPITFFLVGVALFILGLLLWIPKQKIDNEKDKEDLRGKRLDNDHKQLKNATLEEAMKRKIEKARQDLHSEVNSSTGGNTAEQATENVILERAEKNIAIEGTYYRYIKETLDVKCYSTQQEVKLASTVYDIVAESSSEAFPDLIYEVRGWTNQITYELFADTIRQLQNNGLSYGITLERSTKVVLAIVTSKSMNSYWREMIDNYLKLSRKAFNDASVPSLDIEVVAEEDLLDNRSLQTWKTTL